MRVFSEVDLLGEELDRYRTRTSFMEFVKKDLFRGQYVTLSICVPEPLLLRASILCDDISELSGCRFDQVDLLTILFDEYLDQVRRTDDLKFIYNNLMLRDESIQPEVHRYGEEIPFVEDAGPERRKLYIKIKRKSALRGETLLSDLSEAFSDHPYTLERLIQVIYCDFLTRYKKGHIKDGIKKILHYIEGK